MAAIPDGEIISEPHVGHRWRSGYWGWIFTAVEHWNAECVGWHVCKRGELRRPAADLHGACRAVWLDRGRRGSGAGLADGSRLPYLSDHFTNQIKYPAVLRLRRRAPTASPSGSIAREGSMVASRNIAELRDAVRDFVELYNAQWIVEKNGYLSPAQARQAWHAAISIRPAA